MEDPQLNSSNSGQNPDQGPVQTPQRRGILDKTLKEILTSNKQAQNLIMKAMRITPEKFGDLLNKSENNQMMNMTIRDLFKNGIVQQAVQAPKLNQEQTQQLVETIQQDQKVQPLQTIDMQQPQAAENDPASSATPRPSILEKIKYLFK